MAKFKFLFEKLLEYRRLQEKWAKDAYTEVLARKIEVENEIDSAKKRRSGAAQARPCALDGRLTLDTYLDRLDDEVRSMESVLGILENDVEAALQVWNLARQDAEVFEKLKETEMNEWNLDQNRREQAELDEWAVFRRVS